MATAKESQPLLNPESTFEPPAPAPPPKSPPSSLHMPPPSVSAALDPLEERPIVTFPLSIVWFLRTALLGCNLAAVIIGTVQCRGAGVFFLIVLYVGLFWNAGLVAAGVVGSLKSVCLKNRPGFPKIMIQIGSFRASFGGRALVDEMGSMRFPGESVLGRPAEGGGGRNKHQFTNRVRVKLVDCVLGFFGIISAALADIFWGRWYWDNTPMIVLLGFITALQFLIPILSYMRFFRRIKVRIYRDEEEDDSQYEYVIRIPGTRSQPMSMAGGNMA